MGLNFEKIETLAPDQGSLDAARKLLKITQWPTLAADGSGLIWGECQGSGATPYRVCVTEADAGYKCSCPSRKFPCKHSLALMWLRTDGKATFGPGAPPEWVRDWLSRRRGPSDTSAADPTKPTKTKASIAAAREVEDAPDPKAEARAAAARERNRQDREASIAGGLDELDIWLSDQIDTGLAGFAANAVNACRTIAQRLVDAKASGLAARLDALPARLFACSDAARPHTALEELGQLHLIAEAYRRQSLLSPELKADVRQAVGWTVTRESLLADPTAERLSGRWQVWATRAEVQPDRLRRLETWLYGSGRFAVLIDFVPVATGATASGYTVGDGFDAELVFYPSPVPLRALVVTQTSPAQPGGIIDLANGDLETAYAAYEAALSIRPWLAEYPFAFEGAEVRRAGECLYLCGGDLALPLAAAQEASAWPLLRTGPFRGLGLWDGMTFDLRWAETSLGRWTA
ncbi:SWIM zinc finger family protein [Asticcacaulis excentricus]|uniref:SWIM-type domain-containing protein n=1 Tax=Asticcacaulis excentricus (strain ATCC 15261 / DSM 4724 / KCTC 12464 / NCIMB 9791 / VKM B-1370 / CB 48) TaxID=573065 RepID=E8RKD7_ASTEC|nr:SWIM zinc finger family protein [Asticcacaulis excentricus]ADU12417.1 hypothetical protein Astex_0732 [Asticcacaulis excentricus CB 48]